MQIKYPVLALYRLGWTEHHVNAALLIMENGTAAQKNKLFSEVAPQLRKMWHFSAGESFAKRSDRSGVA